MINQGFIPVETYARWRNKTYNIIFKTNTKASKAFDVYLLVAIVCSVGVIILDSVQSIKLQFSQHLILLEWLFTILFTIEYILRISSIKRPRKYIFSLLGLIDLIAILPSYFTLFFVETNSLQMVRVLRLLRVFRVFKLRHYIKETHVLQNALRASRRKIIVFLGFLFTAVLVIGACMHIIEGNSKGFENIPQSTYWAIITMTTVGYGDVVPHTIIGKTLASLLMIIGYAIIAIPTGILSAEIAKKTTHALSHKLICSSCLKNHHDSDARFCKYCSSPLNLK